MYDTKYFSAQQGSPARASLPEIASVENCGITAAAHVGSQLALLAIIAHKNKVCQMGLQLSLLAIITCKNHLLQYILLIENLAYDTKYFSAQQGSPARSSLLESASVEICGITAAAHAGSQLALQAIIACKNKVINWVTPVQRRNLC